jgi:hypothetical protein
MSTPDLIAKVWEILDWPKALQLAVILIVTGVAAALVLTALVLAGRTMIGGAATWPVSITITATVSYRIACHRRR